MVIRFKDFIANPVALDEMAAMVASGAKSEGHVEKYLSKENIKKFKYTMAKDSEGAKKGEEVTVKRVVHNAKDGKKYAHIEHANGRSVVPINHLMKPPIGRAGKNPEQQENTAADKLHKSIQSAVKENGGKPIKIKQNGKMYSVTGARKVVKGDYEKGRKPKGDIILHNEGEPQIHISHKAKAEATGAQNYEGLSNHQHNDQVKGFLDDMRKKHPRGLKNGHSYVRQFSARSSSGRALQRSVMFGSQHDSKQHGVHNVHSIEHGPITLRKHPAGHYEIVSDKSIRNDSSFDPKEHPLEFTARYAAERKDHGIENARIGIAKQGSRPSSKKV